MAYKHPTRVTSKSIKQLLPTLLKEIGARHQMRPDLILAAWPSLIGEHLAPMAKAISFIDGVLTIKVRNSSLLSLLAQHEKSRLLKELRSKFPHVLIRNIRFSIG